MRHSITKRATSAFLATGLTVAMLFATVPAYAVDDVPAPVETVEPTAEPTSPTEVPVEPGPAPEPTAPLTPAAVAFPAPEVSAATSHSVELRWSPPTAGAEWSDFDVLVFLGSEPLEQVTHELDSELKGSPFTPLPADSLDGAEVGIILTGLAAGTDYQFVVRSGERDAALSGRTETIRTPDESAADGAVAEQDDAEQPTPQRRDSSSSRVVEAPVVSPTAPIVTAKGGTSLLVTWAAYDAVATPETPGYAVYTVTVHDVAGAVVKTQFANFVTSAVVTGLTPGTTYSVELKEASTASASGQSAAATTFAASSVPGVIPGLATGQAAGPGQITASWPSLEEGAEVRTYTVKAYLNGALAFTKTGIDPFTTGTNWTFTGLLAATAYTLTVTAVGYDGTGAESAQSADVVTARGVSAAPTGVTLVRAATTGTGVKAAWVAPAGDGGYTITGYRLEFYNTASTATANLVRVVDVAATATSYDFENMMIVGSAIGVRVSAFNAAGQSAFSTMSAGLTIPTAGTTVTATTIELSNATADGFTVSWTAPSAATAATGYVARVVEHLPGNAISNSSNYTYRIIDLGTDWATSGTLSTTVTGLEGGKLYQVALTPYQVNGDAIDYRSSSGRSTKATGETAQSGKLATLGSTRPLQPLGKAATPTVTGSDSVQFSGAALADRHTGGSAITGYRIEIYRGGTSAAVQSVTAESPAYTFTGLDRDTLYQVRYAGINANGEGALSDASDAVRTLARPVPGSVPPRYTTLPELLAAIEADDVTEVSAESVALDRALESNTSIHFTVQWDGASEFGEAWLYPEDGAAAFRSEFTVVDGRAVVDVALGDLATGGYHLALYPDAAVTTGGTPIAVSLRVTRPVTGPTQLDDAVFRWGINNESNNGAFFGGCNFLVAGKAPDVGSASVFTAGRYSSAEGNVSIVKPNAAGEYVPATWGNKCLTRTGQPVTTSVTTPFTESQVVITGGTGTVDPSTNSATLQWTGDFTVVFYGGLTFWYASDPKLVVENGVGTVTATASGFGTDMDDQTKWDEIAPREITLANLGEVRMTSQGFVTTPAYLGVSVDVEGTPQTPKTTANAAYWGSFPQDFVDFQALTGQLSYWYASAGSQDASKPTLPLHIGYDAASFEDPDPGSGAGSGSELDQPAALAPPVAPARAVLRPGLATTTTTTVSDLATLLALIEDETIRRVTAAEAGIPASFEIGEVLHFDIPWEGEATSGSIWWYPGASYAGSFRVVDGRVVVAIDSSVIEQEGEIYFVFFGENGESVAVSTVASGRVVRSVADTPAAAEIPAAELPESPPAEPADLGILIGVIIGAGALALGAGAASIVIVRRRAVL